MDNTLTLYELNAMVREVIETEMVHEYWVEAELSDVRESRGHCYMELIQKDGLSNTPIARASAKCWRTVWTMAQPHFERITGQRLHAGLKVRLKVYAQFHEAFGFSWIVTDIDPNYTLGDMARRRQEIVAQLKKEGVFDLQKELSLPLFCLRIAVISSETAAGYGDFLHQLGDSKFAFRTQLFPTIMQGEQVEESIIKSLNDIFQQQDNFDVVVIIRGGGATADMSGFDTLPLAENVSQFPIPIITGIGHDRDESILDMVSFLRVKTPTAAAAFLIEHAQKVLDLIDSHEQRIAHEAQSQLSILNTRLTTLSARIPALFSVVRTRSEAHVEKLLLRMTNSLHTRLSQEDTQLNALQKNLVSLTNQQVLSKQHQLELLQQRAQLLDPHLLLKRGYSITLSNGKAVRNANDLHQGDEIETHLEHGTIKSIVK